MGGEGSTRGGVLVSKEGDWVVACMYGMACAPCAFVADTNHGHSWLQVTAELVELVRIVCGWMPRKLL